MPVTQATMFVFPCWEGLSLFGWQGVDQLGRCWQHALCTVFCIYTVFRGSTPWNYSLGVVSLNINDIAGLSNVKQFGLMRWETSMYSSMISEPETVGSLWKLWNFWISWKLVTYFLVMYWLRSFVRPSKGSTPWSYVWQGSNTLKPKVT